MPVGNGTPDLRGKPSIVGMSQWLQTLGHSAEQVNALNVVHIAGTKGKGSTCAFTESFLRAHGHRSGFPRKTGLYTGPHLILPEERIRIDSRPLERELFAKYFFEVHDKLSQTSTVDHGPRYLQLFALLALHVFIREQVDVAILETHNGGEYDATNVVEQPLVTAITSLGMDHVDSLGPTIENIAWHKSGIYKIDAVALSTTQDTAPAKVLQKRAAEKGEVARFIELDSRLPAAALQLRPHVQKKNASLAIAAAEAWLAAKAPISRRTLSREDIDRGVEQWSWPGRFQVIRENRTAWFLDAAHNEMSMHIASHWFSEASDDLRDDTVERVVMFSHISETRDAASLLRALANALKEDGARISHIIFTTYDASEQKKGYKLAQDPRLFHDIWKQVFPKTKIWDEATIQGACRVASSLSQTNYVHVFITGSQHLVGPVLDHLQRSSNQSAVP